MRDLRNNIACLLAIAIAGAGRASR